MSKVDNKFTFKLVDISTQHESHGKLELKIDIEKIKIPKTES